MESEWEIDMAAPEDGDVSKNIDEEGKGFVDFEFTFESLPASPVPADVVFFEWRMKQMFPVMSSDEIRRATEIAAEETEEEAGAEDVNNVGRRRPRGRSSLGELMKVEKELAFPSNADESEAAAVGPHCAWKPPSERKSNRSSKRWCRLRDCLRRGSSVHGKSAADSSLPVVRRRIWKKKEKMVKTTC